MVARALARAEDTLASYLNFYLGPRFLIDYDLLWTDPLTLRWGHIIGGGIQGLTEVTATGSDFTTDPATITVNMSDFPGGTSEILIEETTSGLEIVPDFINIVGTTYIININQCKLIEWEHLVGQTTATCIEYDPTFPDATWLRLAELTIYREYLDTSSQATVTFGPSCACIYAGAACAGSDYTGCVYVINEEISKVRVSLADYAAGAWTCTCPILCGCYVGDKVIVRYRAGTTNVPGWEDAVMQLAHTYMIVEPCGCTLFKLMVQQDKNVPSVLTAERINCPFGTSDGAWAAWIWVTNHMHGKAIML